MSISKGTTVEQAFDYASEKAPDRNKAWMILWQLSDVQAQAEENDLELTEEECQEALRYFRNHYDYIWETSWMLMDEAVKAVQERKEKEAKSCLAV